MAKIGSNFWHHGDGTAASGDGCSGGYWYEKRWLHRMVR